MQNAAELVGPTVPAVPALSATELAEEWLPRIHRFAVMVSPPGGDADDLAQAACLRAIERLAQYDPRRGSLDAWLWRIVVNLAHDRGRMARRGEMLVGRLLSDRRRSVASASPESLALDRLRDEDLVAAVRRLPRRYRSLVALRYGADLEVADIATLLGTTRMSVAKAMRRALDRLRADLAGTEVES
jgi:RNA polymerase sigma-70 factor (ECF subfamily)